MDKMRHTPRLYMDVAFLADSTMEVSGSQAHYLRNVMRMEPGDYLRIFNGREGEYVARIHHISKKAVEIILEKLVRPQQSVLDLWLCAAPIKKMHFDYMLEKATELGVSVFQPILTQRTQIREMNIDRCRTIALEAAEQSERLDIPEIRQPLTLTDLVRQWPQKRLPVICAEMGEADVAAKALASLKGQTVAFLTGPEGGFADEEFETLRQLEAAVFIRLGPRILRADTAAIAALSLWQGLCGDWR